SSPRARGTHPRLDQNAELGLRPPLGFRSRLHLSGARRGGASRLSGRSARGRGLPLHRAVSFRPPPHSPYAPRARDRDRRRTRPVGSAVGSVRVALPAAAARGPGWRAGARGARRMSVDLEPVLFDIGGVLGTNGWDREQRTAAAVRFDLDADDVQYRHEETIGDLESGRI